ncbi:T9SS type A sorting domain-containing protein [Soonwooa sp.]|uniref:T9SS type A sorting domain-containing protein n=1 Tax=Soonwooa sp. TaxID=1938592 RepID=UPI0039173C7D
MFQNNFSTYTVSEIRPKGLKSKIDGIEIYSIDGRLVQKFNTSLEKYAISNQPAGAYLIKINSNNKISVNQLIKK